MTILLRLFVLAIVISGERFSKSRLQNQIKRISPMKHESKELILQAVKFVKM